MRRSNPQEKAVKALQESGLNVSLTAETIERIEEFILMRSRWANTHNLSGPKAHKDPWLIDVNDALALGCVLKSAHPLFDVGSGSGVPGLLLKIIRPEIELVIVEPLAKRVAFLKTAVHKMKLDGVRVIRSRWPIGVTDKCEVVSRAVVSPKKWPSLANDSSCVCSIYRYLALDRPTFNTPGFELAGAIDYRRSADERLRVERWDRIVSVESIED